MLADRAWKLKYTPEDGDLVKLFYVPALEDAERYDRLTGYFKASALALAARGIEGLVRNGGHMRLIVGCTLDPPEIDAIEKGETLRSQVEKHLTDMPLVADDGDTEEALELLSWMVQRGRLHVKVAIPCDANGKPIHDQGIFHEKAGIVQDRAGNRIAWSGSLNETAAGWQHNWESISVFKSWAGEGDRIDGEERNFSRLWVNEPDRWTVLDVPEAVRQDLMGFMPDGDMPRRLKDSPPKRADRDDTKATKPEPTPDTTAIAEVIDRRSLVWSFIREAPRLPGGGALIGEATAAVVPWPHQVRAFSRLYDQWPPKLLIADEVGLGKTIQAGMVLRQAWLSGRAKRILILAPKGVLKQWQIELREKFNLNWPIYDGRKLVWYPSPALAGHHEREVDRSAWHEEPIVIASSHLMRRQERAKVLLEDAEPWDLVVLDEAHHARRRGAGSASEGGPNALLRLMRELKDRTKGLVLLTATPMQVHPIEVWDLLDLLGLPREWTTQAFLQFFDDLNHPNPSDEAMERMARLFRAVEREYEPVTTEAVERRTKLSRLKANRLVRALRDDARTPRQQLETAERRAAIAVMRSHTPIRYLVSRHTRSLLRRYAEEGKLETAIASRKVEDRFVDMSEQERDLYEAVEAYIKTSYNQASAKEKGAVGFVMTIYRRRLSSSVYALRTTLERHYAAVKNGGPLQLEALDEDIPDDETMDEILDAEEAQALERQGLAAEEHDDIEQLLERIKKCPPDSKLETLKDTLAELREGGYEQVMVFTQYGDTMDFLREALHGNATRRVMCYSGRGGEIPTEDGEWRTITRDEAKRRFRLREADILLCTDAAAEGLNFQFCGAIVNYEMPWNPMRVEQRIGRIDRLGQRHDIVRIVNLHYEDTVETDVYKALRVRINMFERVVGALQPILAQLPRTITDAVLSRPDSEGGDRSRLVERIERQVDEKEVSGFDIDAVLDEEVTMPERPTSPITMNDLDRVIGSPALMPPGTQVRALGEREYALRAPGMTAELRVTTDPDYYEEHAESVELWSPGNPVFTPPGHLTSYVEVNRQTMLEEILDREQGP